MNSIKCFSQALFLACLLYAQSSALAAVLYGPVTNLNNGHLYYLLTPNTWLEAQAEAETLGGNLVTISDSSEQQWIYGTFASYQSTPRPLWTGLNDAAVEGQFVWASGESLGFMNWGDGEPNNAGEAEDYVGVWAANGTQPSKWNDLPASELYYGVVEVVPPFAAVIRVSEVTLAWPSVPGKEYQVQFKDSATDPTWEDVGQIRTGTGGTIEFADKVGVGLRLYQIRELP